MTDERADGQRSEFEQRAREAFERSTAALDGPTRSRLTQARHRALRELERPALLQHGLRWSPRAAVAALVVAAIGAGWLALDLRPAVSPVEGIAATDDFELLLGDDDLELIEELEFYAWLEEQPEFRAQVDDGAG